MTKKAIAEVLNGPLEMPPTFRPALDKHGQPYEGYFVDCHGNVGSLQPVLFGAQQVKRFHILQASKGNPYRQVLLCVGAKRVNVQVHTLVARSWIGMPTDPDMHVNHKDCDKKHNLFLNLEWTTRKGNAEHASLNGLLSRGAERHNAILTEHSVRDIRLMYAHGYTQSRLAIFFHVEQTNICKVVKRKTWAHVA